MRKAGLHKSNVDLYVYLMRSLKEGFSLELDEAILANLSESCHNIPSTEAEKNEIDKYWLAAMDKGWLVGPFKSPIEAAHYCSPEATKPAHLNPLFTVFSGNKIRVITHFSAPKKGVSLNSAVNEHWATVSYVSFRKQCEIFNAAGKGGWIWVIDAEEAYLQLKVRKDHWHLMGARWRGKIYLITVLMLGLCCAPRIYTEFADAVLLMLLALNPGLGVEGLLTMIAHYLDDFFGASKYKDAAVRQFEALMKLFRELNIPFKDSKCKFPAQIMKVLGFIHNTLTQCVYIPDNKRAEMVAAIKAALLLGYIDKDEARSLVGRLRWAGSVFFGGSCFVRSLEVLASRKHAASKLLISAKIQADLEYWLSIIEANKGMPYAFILALPQCSDWIICSDACSKIGFAATSTTGEFFQMRWTELWPGIKEVDIYLGESLAMAVMLQLCIRSGGGERNVLIYLDNEGSKYAYQNKYCVERRADVNRFLRETCVLCNHSYSRYWAERIPTDENAIADALSRFEPVNIAKQPAKYGVHPLSKQFSQAAVKQAVVHLLGEFWAVQGPPTFPKSVKKPASSSASEIVKPRVL